MYSFFAYIRKYGFYIFDIHDTIIVTFIIKPFFDVIPFYVWLKPKTHSIKGFDITLYVCH